MKRKLILDLFKGGKKAAIGETRNWGGKDYVKTQEGWQYQPGNKEKKAPETAKQPEQAASVESKPSESQETPKEAPVKKPRKPRAKKEAKKEESKEPAETPKEIPSTNTPRSEAAPSEASKEEYANARESAISNVGKDIKGAARHRKVYSSIKDLRNSDEANIDLKYLLKQFPINLIDDVSTSNAFNPYIANQILNRFPKTIKSEKQREMYLDTFDFVRNRVQELSKEKDLLFTDILKTIQKEVVDKMKANRAAPGYVRGSDDFLVSYVNKTLSIRATKGSVAQDVVDYVAATKTLIPDVDGLSRQEATAKAYEEMASEEGVERVKKILEGADFKKVFSVESKGNKSKKFNVSDMYLKEAKRKGPETELKTVDEQVDFMVKKCELKAIQWGNSVTDDERKHHLKMSADAFSDLGDILGLPEKMISYNGRLGLAIGARGHGTAMAHYESDEVVINLTRAKGVGSLAHEWGHFVDNILAKTHKVNAHADNTFLSEAARWNLGESSPVKDAMKELVGSEVWQDFTNTTRQALRDLQEMGIKEKAQYWMSPRELFARAFEAYVSYKLEEKGRENTYLSGGSEGLMWCNKEQKEKMAPLFDKIFKELRESDYIEKALTLDSDINKHDFSPKKNAKLHGWIDPQGQYYHMPPDAGHLDFIKNKGLDYQGAVKQGWISVGHGGDLNVGVHKDTLKSKLHPAMKTLRKLIGDGGLDRDHLHIDVHGHKLPPKGWSPLHTEYSFKVYPDIFSKHGLVSSAIYATYKPLAASEITDNNLMKGSISRRMPFNPVKDVSPEERQKVEYWQGAGKEREKIPEMSEALKKRAVRNLHKLTEVRRHPETGEKMFLMHRGMSQLEADGLKHNKKHDNLSSWTPNIDIAQGFTKDQEGTNPHTVVSAWIPESAIHHIPKMIGDSKLPVTNPKQFLDVFKQKLDSKTDKRKVLQNTFRGEHEVIVKPHQLTFGKTPNTQEMRNDMQTKINRRFNDSLSDKSKYKAKDLEYVAGGKYGDPKETRNVKAKYGGDSKFLEQKKLAASELNENDLMKAADDDAVAKLPESHQHLKEPLLNWSRESIPHAPMRTWYLNHVAKNPEIHDTHKEEMKHHGDMARFNQEIGKIPFSKKVSLEEGLNKLREADKAHQAKTPEISGIRPNKDTTKRIDLGNGWGWHDLGTNQDDDEARAMGHCGTGHPDCNLWSLRKEVKDKKGNVYHQPHVTVEMLEGGIINQIKGKNNEKPNKKYHDAILPLLHSEHVNHIISQGYRPETNFHVGDLEESHHKDLISKKPDIHPFEMTDLNQLDQTIEKMPHDYRRHLNDWKEMVETFSDHARGQGITNPTHKDIIDNAINWGNKGDHNFLTKHPSINGEQLHDLYTHQLVNKTGYEVLKNPNTLPKTLHEAVTNPKDSGHLLQAAKHPSLPEEDMRELAKLKDNYYLQTQLTRNPAVPQDIVEGMWNEHKNKEVDGDHEDLLREIAAKANLTPQMRQEAMSHPSQHIRRKFSERQDLTDSEMLQISQDEDSDTPYRLTLRKELPENVIDKLLERSDTSIHHSLSRHPSAQPRHLKKIAEKGYDENEYRNILNHPNLDEDTLHAMINPNARAFEHKIAGHRNSTAGVLHRLRGSVADSVRGQVARHDNTGPETLKVLAKDKDANVRQDVAMRQDLSPEIVKMLENDPDPVVKETLYRYQPGLLHKLAASEEIITDLSKNEDVKQLARRGILLAGLIGMGSTTGILGYRDSEPHRKIASYSAEQAKKKFMEDPIMRDREGTPMADIHNKMEDFSKIVSSIPVNPQFAAKNIAGNEELNKEYKHLLQYPPQMFKEEIDKHPKFKKDLARSYFPHLAKQHNYHQPKMLSHYRQIVK